MAVSRALRRLLRIRDLEEEQQRLALESALGEMQALERALEATTDRDRWGRELSQGGVRSGEWIDRQAGIVETGAAHRSAAVLMPRLAASEEEAAHRRAEFVRKRIERRQAETLIEQTEASDALEAGRRSQQSLDEWYRSRLYRQNFDAKSEDDRDSVSQAGGSVDCD
jgi:hypothetical protein